MGIRSWSHVINVALQIVEPVFHSWQKSPHKICASSPTDVLDVPPGEKYSMYVMSYLHIEILILSGL